MKKSAIGVLVFLMLLLTACGGKVVDTPNGTLEEQVSSLGIKSESIEESIAEADESEIFETEDESIKTEEQINIETNESKKGNKVTNSIGTAVEKSNEAAGNIENQVNDTDETEDVQVSESVAVNSVEELQPIPELIGKFKKFETKDIFGNTVNQEIISNAKLTVLNIWGTFCSPCIKEIPYLAEISEEYKEKGVQIVGLVSDAGSEAQINKAKQILESSKASYLNILPSSDLEEIYLNDVYYIPETLFIDDTGTILDSIVGAMDKEGWQNKIDSMLEKVNSL